jgi:hypothetical protein
VATSETNSAELTADGTSAFVPLSPNGSVVSVDCVDANGNSTSWGGASVNLLYSPDGQMVTSARDGAGDVSNQLDGFSRKFMVRGFVAMQVSNYSSGTLRLFVV